MGNLAGLYVLRGKTPDKRQHCSDNCVYSKVGDAKQTKFCFGSGDLGVTCHQKMPSISILLNVNSTSREKPFRLEREQDSQKHQEDSRMKREQKKELLQKKPKIIKEAKKVDGDASNKEAEIPIKIESISVLDLENNTNKIIQYWKNVSDTNLTDSYEGANSNASSAKTEKGKHLSASVNLRQNTPSTTNYKKSKSNASNAKTEEGNSLLTSEGAKQIKQGPKKERSKEGSKKCSTTSANGLP